MSDVASQPPEPHQALIDALTREIRRLERRLRAIERDVARASEAQQLQHKAELLAHNKLPRRGASSVDVMDYALDPPAKVTVELDPAVEPRAQIDAWFKTARRYVRGAELGRERSRMTEAERALLIEARDQLRNEPGAHATDSLLSDPRILRLARAQESAPKLPVDSERVPYREFVGSGGERIWVGRGARDNDLLTTKLARPQDLFLHVRDAKGAHVIVRRDKRVPVSPAALVDAAHLAHHFSQAASDGASDVTYAERRYVQKRRGAPAGTVHLLRSRVLRLRVEPERITRLLATELRRVGQGGPG